MILFLSFMILTIRGFNFYLKLNKRIYDILKLLPAYRSTLIIQYWAYFKIKSHSYAVIEHEEILFRTECSQRNPITSTISKAGMFSLLAYAHHFLNLFNIFWNPQFLSLHSVLKDRASGKERHYTLTAIPNITLNLDF